MSTTTQALALAGVQLFALSTAIPDAFSGKKEVNAKATDKTVLTTASLGSFEASWLKVSPMCKSRMFHADPHPLAAEALPSEVLALYEV